MTTSQADRLELIIAAHPVTATMTMMPRRRDLNHQQSAPDNPLAGHSETSTNTTSMPGRPMASSSSRSTTSLLLLPLALVLSFLSQSSAQLGVTACACSPSAYLLRLNVGLPCSDGTLAMGDAGIADIECVTNPEFTGSPSDLNITSVTFLELDQNLQLLTSSTVTDNLKNGDTVEFASFTANPDQVTTTKLPSTIEVGIMATDKDMNSILTNWVVSFSNACDAYPVISVGDTIGWTEFVSVEKSAHDVTRPDIDNVTIETHNTITGQRSTSARKSLSHGSDTDHTAIGWTTLLIDGSRSRTDQCSHNGRHVATVHQGSLSRGCRADE